MRALPAIAALALAACFAAPAHAQPVEGRTLRVCSDPNNLPFSNEREEGFENRIAELVAEELGADLSYVWWAQRRGFIRNTLDAGACDLVMGVPAGYELTATTAPYYRSAYVFVYPAALGGPDLASIRDARLRDMTIGVHLTGDDGANPPPVHALGRLGLVENVRGYMIYGDYREENPPARLIHAVADGEVDVAAAWGPVGGYFASKAGEALAVTPIGDGDLVGPYPFEFAIAMGLRREDRELRAELDDIIERRAADIEAILTSYHVPLAPMTEREAER